MPSLMERAQSAAQMYKIDPATQDFDEDKSVEGRTARIAASGSPLMKMAETRGTQLAAQRGLTNSSLGVESAQKAVLDSATGIATTDAQLSHQQALANQTARNTTSQSNQSSGTNLSIAGLNQEAQAEQQNKSLMESARQFNAGQAQQQGQFTAGQALTREMFASDEAFRQAQLQQQQQQFASGQTLTREMFSSDDAFRKAQAAQQQQQFAAGQTLTREMFASDDEFRKAQAAQQQGQFTQNLALQARQVDAQIAQFAQSLGMTVQELQLKRDMLNSSDRQALDTLLLQKQQLAQQGSQFSQQLAQTGQQFNAELALKVSQLDTQKDQFAKQLGMTAADLDLRRASLSSSDRQFVENLDLQKQQLAQQANLTTAQLSEQARQFNQSQSSNQSMFQQELAQKNTQFGQSLEAQKVLAQMDIAGREKIAGIEAAFKSDIQGSVNISNAWGTMMTAIGNIQNNPNLEAGAKTTLIQNTIDSFQSFANFWKKTSNVDVSDLLRFNIVAGNQSAPPVVADGQRNTQPVPYNPGTAFPYQQSVYH